MCVCVRERTLICTYAIKNNNNYTVQILEMYIY